MDARDDTNEFRPTPFWRDSLQLGKEFGVVRSVVGIFPRVARGTDPRSTVEGFDAEAGVVGDDPVRP
jgi:hypothetical protein